MSLPAVSAPQAQQAAPAKADAEYLRRAYDTYRSMQRSSPYSKIRWQYLGPTNITGRATDIAVADRGASRRVYAAFATSGVWKTDDNGASWQPVFENEASTSIGDIAVAPSNPDIVWVGTGEANLFRASMAGVGIYKSSDAGRTFAHAGLTDTQTIARIVVHPRNPNVVYVAASGHEWTDNEMRGVFKTTNGGRTWSKVFYRSPRTGAIDLAMDPSSPDTLYAAMWQRIRRKWSDPRVEPGYDEGGIWKTIDGGKTWTNASAGLPAAQFRGRIGIDVAASNPNVLYAFVDSYDHLPTEVAAAFGAAGAPSAHLLVDAAFDHQARRAAVVRDRLGRHVLPLLVEVLRERLGRLDDVPVAVDNEILLAELLGRRAVRVLDRLVAVDGGGFFLLQGLGHACSFAAIT